MRNCFVFVCFTYRTTAFILQYPQSTLSASEKNWLATTSIRLNPRYQTLRLLVVLPHSQETSQHRPPTTERPPSDGLHGDLQSACNPGAGPANDRYQPWRFGHHSRLASGWLSFQGWVGGGVCRRLIGWKTLMPSVGTAQSARLMIQMTMSWMQCIRPPSECIQSCSTMNDLVTTCETLCPCADHSGKNPSASAGHPSQRCIKNVIPTNFLQPGKMITFHPWSPWRSSNSRFLPTALMIKCRVTKTKKHAVGRLLRSSSAWRFTRLTLSVAQWQDIRLKDSLAK